MREQYADQWLGFDLDAVEDWIRAAELTTKHLERIDGATPELPVLFAVGIKPEQQKEK